MSPPAEMHFLNLVRSLHFALTGHALYCFQVILSKVTAINVFVLNA